MTSWLLDLTRSGWIKLIIKTGFCLNLQITPKQSVGLCMRSFSLSNMGEPALKSHAQGKKHQNAVKTSGKNTSVWGFLKKDNQKASTSIQKEEPLACKESEKTISSSSKEY